MKGGIIVDWNAIKAEYIAGGTTYKKLAEKYGESESTLRKTAAKEHWTELRNKTGTKTEQKMLDSVSCSEVKRAVRVKRSASISLENILRKIEAKTAADDISAAELYQSVKTIKEILTIEGIKPRADRQEQQARIDNLRKQAEKDTADNDVTFTIGDDLEEYAI